MKNYLPSLQTTHTVYWIWVGAGAEEIFIYKCIKSVTFRKFLLGWPRKTAFFPPRAASYKQCFKKILFRKSYNQGQYFFKTL
jgi:hypothetical protein